MFKLLGKADTWLDVALRWGGAFSIAWAFLSWLAKRMTWLGTLNWADAVALGLGGAMLLSVIVSFALVAIRYFRPLTFRVEALPAEKPSKENASDHSGVDLREIHARLPEMLGAIDGAERVEKVLSDIGEARREMVLVEAAYNNLVAPTHLRGNWNYTGPMGRVIGYLTKAYEALPLADPSVLEAIKKDYSEQDAPIDAPNINANMRKNLNQLYHFKRVAGPAISNLEVLANQAKRGLQTQIRESSKELRDAARIQARLGFQ